MGIGDLLLENRIIFLAGPIMDDNANLTVMKLLYLQSENRHQDVHMYVNSPGGSVTATMAIYDTMQFLSCDVATYCVGLAASGTATPPPTSKSPRLNRVCTGPMSELPSVRCCNCSRCT